MLYIIPTPIGNLKDMTFRSLEVLQTVDKVICEDTRVSIKLLNHYQIKKPLLALNDFNEAKILPTLLEKLKMGENLALISDAGTPLISDPGYKLVRECLKSNIQVDSLPGPSAVITSLTLSTLPPDRFMFLGFPPDKISHRQNLYQKIKQISAITATTFILFVAPFKLVKTLAEVQTALGDTEVCLAHELTKIHQSVQIKKISIWLNQFKKYPPKGEYALLFRL